MKTIFALILGILWLIWTIAEPFVAAIIGVAAIGIYLGLIAAMCAIPLMGIANKSVALVLIPLTIAVSGYFAFASHSDGALYYKQMCWRNDSTWAQEQIFSLYVGECNAKTMTADHDANIYIAYRAIVKADELMTQWAISMIQIDGTSAIVAIATGIESFIAGLLYVLLVHGVLWSGVIKLIASIDLYLIILIGNIICAIVALMGALGTNNSTSE